MSSESIAGRAGAAQGVDRSALRVNQAFIVGLLALAFVLGQPLHPAGLARSQQHPGRRHHHSHREQN